MFTPKKEHPSPISSQCWGDSQGCEDFDYIAPEKALAGAHSPTVLSVHSCNPSFRDGKLVAQLPKLTEIRQYVQQQLQNEIWTEEQRFENPHQHYLDMSVAYYQ